MKRPSRLESPTVWLTTSIEGCLREVKLDPSSATGIQTSEKVRLQRRPIQGLQPGSLDYPTNV